METAKRKPCKFSSCVFLAICFMYLKNPNPLLRINHTSVIRDIHCQKYALYAY